MSVESLPSLCLKASRRCSALEQRDGIPDALAENQRHFIVAKADITQRPGVHISQVAARCGAAMFANHHMNHRAQHTEANNEKSNRRLETKRETIAHPWHGARRPQLRSPSERRY